MFVDPEAPQRDALQEAAKWIRNGGLVALPTDTLYGLAADPFRPDAVARVFAVKGRDAGERAAAHRRRRGADCGASRSAVAGRASGWRRNSGPVRSPCSSPRRPPLAREVTGGTGRVGVRVPAHDIARAICRAADRPITATSANRSGQPATADPDEVERTLGEDVDLLIDAGPTPGGAPSTIVDVTGATPRLVRAGAIPWDEIQAWLGE